MRKNGERELGYQLLSDSDMTLATKFGLAFRVDDEQVARYASSGFDLAEHPATPIISCPCRRST